MKKGLIELRTGHKYEPFHPSETEEPIVEGFEWDCEEISENKDTLIKALEAWNNGVFHAN